MNANYNLLDYISKNFFTKDWNVKIENENVAIITDKNEIDTIRIESTGNDIDVYCNNKIFLMLTLRITHCGKFEWLCRGGE